MYSDLMNRPHEVTSSISGKFCSLYVRHFDGTTESLMVSGCETFEDARLKAEEMAWHSGWTNPRWWQWWRWGDRKVYLVEPKIKYQPKSDVLQPSQLEPTNK